MYDQYHFSVNSILDGCSIVDNLVNGTREGQRDLGRQLKKMFESVGIFTQCPIAVQNITISDYTIQIGELDPALNLFADVSIFSKALSQVGVIGVRRVTNNPIEMRERHRPKYFKGLRGDGSDNLTRQQTYPLYFFYIEPPDPITIYF